MKSFIRRAAVAALLAGTASATAVVLTVPAQAADAKKDAKKPTVGREVGRPLIDGQKAFNDKDMKTALEEAKKADAVEKKTPYETYEVAKLLGLIYITTQDFADATTQFNRAIDSGGMPDAEKASMLNTALKLNYNAKDWAKAIQQGEEYVQLMMPDDATALIIAQSYYFNNDFAGTDKFVTNYVAEKKSAGQLPQKNLLDTLLNAQIKEKNQAGARKTLEMIAMVNPTPENWGRVIDQAFAQPHLSDHQVLNLYRLRFLTKSMADTDYLAMAGLDLKLGIPAEAQKVLNEGIMSGKLTQAKAATLMKQANELEPKDKASLPDLAKAAATAKTGDTSVKLGESYWAYGRNADAEMAIRQGIQKGNLPDPGDAQVTLGIILLSEGKTDEAKQMFEQAAQANAPGAHVWDLYASTPQKPA